MNQADLQSLARERLLDAEALISTGRWSFAYYAAGYAVECALKSCLLSRMVKTGWVFQDAANIKDCRTHDFRQLVRLSGLEDELGARRLGEARFAANWDRTVRWKVSDRYSNRSEATEAEAREIYAAITDETDGVLTWIMTFW